MIVEQVTPVNGYIVIKRLPPDGWRGSIMIPPLRQGFSYKGKVLRLNKENTLDLHIDDIIQFKVEWNGMEVPIDGEKEIYLLKEDDILGIHA